jgi:hypothetical protein
MHTSAPALYIMVPPSSSAHNSPADEGKGAFLRGKLLSRKICLMSLEREVLC